MDLSHYVRPVPSKKAEQQGDPASNRRNQPGAGPQPVRIEFSCAASRLLTLLSPTVRLTALQAFPRIVNRLADVWHKPSEFERCMDDLLLDTRGNRIGFPSEIVAELTALREYYQTKLHPKKNDPWSTVRARS